MGLPIPPDEPIIGDNCFNWSPPSATPHQIVVSFSDIENGFLDAKLPSEKYSMILTLTQDPGDHCRWETQGGGPWGASANMLGAAHFQLGLAWNDGVDQYQFFVNSGATIASGYAANEQLFFPPFFRGFGGDAQITWYPGSPSPSIKSIMDALNMTEDPTRFYDFWPLDEDEMVVRFADQKESTNIKILWEMDP